MLKLDDSRIDEITKKNIRQWMEGDVDQESKNEILRMAQEDTDQLINSFYQRLSFGTGGLRGVMGVGTNRMNYYTVRAATLGLANYLQKQLGTKKKRVFISYDCRHNSRLFAEQTAQVLAANNIEALITKELRPTPLASFGCRHFNCDAAIMITASHNPPEYNGYKVYWNDGGQIIPPHDKGIIAEVEAIEDLSKIAIVPFSHHLIKEVGVELDSAYCNAMDDLRTQKELTEKCGAELDLIYSGLHGTGSTMVPMMLKAWGFTHIHEVIAQKEPDGSFPTVSSPNPENREALHMGIEELHKNEADLFLANDPDADRLGVAVRHNGRTELLNGNQIACICLEHLCQSVELTNKTAFVKTLVTTELFAAIAKHYKTPCFDTLPGFKYIAQKIDEWDKDGSHCFLFGGEESYGYLLGTKVRDKDAVVASCLLAEVALQAKKQGKTLINCLNDLYEKYGVYRESLISVQFPETKQGRLQMQKAMEQLREEPPTEVNGKTIICVEDYLLGSRTTLSEGSSEPLHLPTSNILVFWLQGETKAVVRPSGTEPKIKIYAGAKGTSVEETDELVQGILNYLKRLLLSRV